MTAEFVHLHLHSDFSLLDGACRFDSLMKRVKEHKMPAVALTDHGNLFGAVGFYKACKAAGIKPIIGCEVYIAPRGRRERGESGERRSANHLLLLAKDYDGYKNLAKLSSIGYTEGYYYKPRIDLEVLNQYSAGLLCTSGCLKGQIPEAVVEGNGRKARDLVGAYLDIFGRDNFYFEVMDHGLTEQKTVLRAMREFTKEFDVPLLATNDCHYVRREDADFHNVMLCIQTGKTLQDAKRFKFEGDTFYMRTAEEMYDVFAEMPEACRETLAVAERCNIEMPFNQRLLPAFSTPDGSTVDDYLREVAFAGLARRYGEPNPDQIARADMELTCIRNMGFSSYFLIVWDFIHYAKVNGIPVGPGRGSAAGSLVAYCLEITDIDPLEHGLIFERFLNPERVSMPDIDIDFCFENRGRVIDYVKQKYGDRNVAQIITFGTLKPRNAIRDVGRALNMPLDQVDRIAKLVPAVIKPEKGKTMFETALDSTPDLRQVYENDQSAKRLVDYAKQMEGMARHASTHAAGVVICDRDVTDIVPVYKPPDSPDIATQFTMTTVEEIGLLKMDFLGLKNLTIIENTLKSVRKNYGVEIDWAKIPLTDEPTFKLLQAGRTFGVFQLESSGMTGLVKALQPTEFSEITALLALYRPGPLGSGMHLDFVERKHGRKPVEYDHPLLEPILRETFGIILYQEQVMKIAQVMGGLSLGEADLMRRAMGKKKAEEMAKVRVRFIEGAKANGIDEKLAGEVFNKIEYFSGYGFNKSHSAAYALISYRTAYLKAHYPVDYMAALMTNAIGDKVENMAAFFAQAKDSGIAILPPDVNESEKLFSVREGTVRFGLAAVKNVGEAAVEGIIKAREEGGPFRSFDEFCLRVDLGLLTSRMIECLIRVGGFDSLGLRRSQLLDAYEKILEVASQRQKEKQSGQASLFDMFEEPVDEDLVRSGESAPVSVGNLGIPLRDIPEIPDREKLQYEKELIGHYVSGHPLAAYACDIAAFSNCALGAIPDMKDGADVTVVGMVTKITPKVDRNGSAWGFVEVGDMEATAEILFFRDAYEHSRPLLAIDEVVWIKGRVSKRNEDTKLIANEARKIQDMRDKVATALELTLEPEGAANGMLDRLAVVFRSFPGRKPVRLRIRLPQGELRVEIKKGCSVAISNDLLTRLGTLPGVKSLRLLKD